MVEQNNPDKISEEKQGQEREESTKEPVPTEISETVYMGEGKPGINIEATELTETAYMGEPEEPSEHESEDKYQRTGEKIGKANHPPSKNKNAGEAA